MTPIPEAASFDALNVMLAACCRTRQSDCAGRHAETIGVFTKSAGNPIARAVRTGADAVAKANGVTVFHYIPMWAA